MTNTDPERDPVREWTAALFGKAEPDEPAPPDPRPANFVQTEGTNPTGEAHDMRAFVKALFYPDPPDA